MPAPKTWVGGNTGRRGRGRERERERDAESDRIKASSDWEQENAQHLYCCLNRATCRVFLFPDKVSNGSSAPIMHPPLYFARKKSTVSRCPEEVWLLRSPEQETKMGCQFVRSLTNALARLNPGMLGFGARVQSCEPQSLMGLVFLPV